MHKTKEKPCLFLFTSFFHSMQSKGLARGGHRLSHQPWDSGTFSDFAKACFPNVLTWDVIAGKCEAVFSGLELELFFGADMRSNHSFTTMVAE